MHEDLICWKTDSGKKENNNKKIGMEGIVEKV